jgi:hypothetical protein
MTEKSFFKTQLKRFIDGQVERRQAIIQKPYDLCVGGEETPHFYRWELYTCRWLPWLLKRVFPRSDGQVGYWFKIYLHHFVADDNDPILHDHKYVNLSILLFGGYIEEQFASDPNEEYYPVSKPEGGWFFVKRKPGELPQKVWIERKEGHWYMRCPATAHRIDMIRHPGNGLVLDCWSLFFCGPEVREWGFWCPKGWRHWSKYVVGDYGARGVSQKGGGCES